MIVSNEHRFSKSDSKPSGIEQSRSFKDFVQHQPWMILLKFQKKTTFFKLTAAPNCGKTWTQHRAELLINSMLFGLWTKQDQLSSSRGWKIDWSLFLSSVAMHLQGLAYVLETDGRRVLTRSHLQDRCLMVSLSIEWCRRVEKERESIFFRLKNKLQM